MKIEFIEKEFESVLIIPILNEGQRIIAQLNEISRIKKRDFDIVVVDGNSIDGSVQNIDIPLVIKNMYKTVWEIKQKSIIDLAIDRSPYVCQTQSMNLFFEEPTQTMLTSALFYGWKNGLKTGSYYIRSRPKVQAQQFTIEPIKNKKENNYESCEMCSA